MVKIIGNNIAHLINEKIKGEKDPKEARTQIIEDLEKHIPKNRLTGLIKGTFSINRNEIWIVKEVLGCDSADDVVIVDKDE